MSSIARNVAKLPPLPTIKELIRLYKLRALKHLSQNFILDLKLTDRIVRHAGDITCGEVCEIGPGPGNITRSILNQFPQRVLLIEKDTRFQPMLQLLQESATTKMDIVFGDVMGYDMSDSFDTSLRKDWKDDPPNIHLIGNLPFSVSTHLIIMWLRDISLRTSAWSYGRVKMTLTFQEEVAQRMVAQPGEKQRCRLSVMCQNWCNVRHKFTIPGTAFLPKPDVNVGVVNFEPLIKPLIPVKFEIVEKVLRTVFNSRMKYSIKPAERLFPESIRETLAGRLYRRAQLDPKIRPYEMKNEEWGRLILAYKEICDRDPRLYDYNYRGEVATREKGWEPESEEISTDGK